MRLEPCKIFICEKLKKGKAKGNYLPAKSQGRQILMNELILLFTAVLQDKAGMW
jgi:hypothetical protein